jgi:hypothetical protein
MRLLNALLGALALSGCALDVNGLGPVAADGGPAATTGDAGAVGDDAGGDAGDAPLSPASLPPMAPPSCTDTCAGCCTVSGACMLGNTATSCGPGRGLCVDCTQYAAYCDNTGYCSIDPAGAPAWWDGGR